MTTGSDDVRKAPDAAAPDLDRLAPMWWRLVLVVGSLGLLCATLFPFALDWPQSLPEWKAEAARRIDLHLHTGGGLGDFFGNVVLFVPFGFGLAGLLLGRGMRPWRAVLSAGLWAAGLSACIEATQLLVPSRNPALGDFVSNAVGGFVGAAAGWLVGPPVLRCLSRLLLDRGSTFLSARKLAALFALYAAVVFTGSLAMARTRPFAGWDADMPLVIGDESTGHYRWLGVVSDLLIADRAMTPREADCAVRALYTGGQVKPDAGVIGFYPLGFGSDPTDRAGVLPPLEGRPQPTGEDPAVGAKNSWFQSRPAGREISRRIAATSQFTLSLTASATQPVQFGPASIVTLSRTEWERNLTLSHQDGHVLVRLRTPFTGQYGTSPQFLLPYVFAKSSTHRITVCFTGRRLRTYDGDRLVDDVDLSPEVLSVWSILPYRPMSVVLGRTDASMWRWGYDIIVFVPLGLLAGLLAGATPLATGARVFWGVGAVLAPPLAMQLLVAAIDGPPVGWKAATSGAAVAAAAAGLALACCLRTVRPGTGTGRPMAANAA